MFVEGHGFAEDAGLVGNAGAFAAEESGLAGDGEEFFGTLLDVGFGPVAEGFGHGWMRGGLRVKESLAC